MITAAAGLRAVCRSDYLLPSFAACGSDPMNMKIPIAIALVAVGGAVGFFGARTYEQAQAAKRLDAQMQRAASNDADIRRHAEQWADALAMAEGEAVLRSFAAGLAPTLLSCRGGSLDVAGTSLLRLDGVRGVTILRADGKALYASDAKLTVSEAGNEQTHWALTARDFMSRAAAGSGTTEMALPITDRGTVIAIVWLEFDAKRVRDSERPPDLSLSSPPAGDVAR
jgi:hypothetical protein